jgi:hypothetical protein
MAWYGRPRRAPELIAYRRLREGRLLSLFLPRRPGRAAEHLARPEAAQLRRALAIEVLATREALKTLARRGSPARTARSRVAAHSEYPVLERRRAKATHCRRRTDRRLCERSSWRSPLFSVMPGPAWADAHRRLGPGLTHGSWSARPGLAVWAASGCFGGGLVLLDHAGGDPATVADRDALISRPRPDNTAALTA